MTQLGRDDIRRGLAALEDELGRDRAIAFLRAVAEGALDPYLREENPLLSWARRNPEAITLGAVLLGTVGTAALQHYSRRRRKPDVAADPHVQRALAIITGEPPPAGAGPFVLGAPDRDPDDD